MQAYDSLIDALSGLKQKGYTTDFNIAFDKIKCAATGVCLVPGQFEITEHYRFEGASDPEDSSVLYVIESIDGSMKGTLISAYGVYSDMASEEMIRKLSVHHG